MPWKHPCSFFKLKLISTTWIKVPCKPLREYFLSHLYSKGIYELSSSNLYSKISDRFLEKSSHADTLSANLLKYHHPFHIRTAKIGPGKLVLLYKIPQIKEARKTFYQGIKHNSCRYNTLLQSYLVSGFSCLKGQMRKTETLDYFPIEYWILLRNKSYFLRVHLIVYIKSPFCSR